MTTNVSCSMTPALRAVVSEPSDSSTSVPARNERPSGNGAGGVVAQRPETAGQPGADSTPTCRRIERMNCTAKNLRRRTIRHPRPRVRRPRVLYRLKDRALPTTPIPRSGGRKREARGRRWADPVAADIQRANACAGDSGPRELVLPAGREAVRQYGQREQSRSAGGPPPTSSAGGIDVQPWQHPRQP